MTYSCIYMCVSLVSAYKGPPDDINVAGLCQFSPKSIQSCTDGLGSYRGVRIAPEVLLDLLSASHVHIIHLSCISIDFETTANGYIRKRQSEVYMFSVAQSAHSLTTDWLYNRAGNIRVICLDNVPLPVTCPMF